MQERVIEVARWRAGEEDPVKNTSLSSVLPEKA